MNALVDEGKSQADLGTYRDTVESIGVAIVLAFVLRAFFIEAFVIPTGSMAPRLLGEHWDLTCPSCGYQFAYGYSAGDRSPSHTSKSPPNSAVCPNCHTAITEPEFLNGGDRVLVMKYLYDFADPQPFDVVVFKNPQDNRENYIKRLIGLPGETIEIVHGDVFVSASPDPNFPRAIRRKPVKAQEAMWQVVYDNDYYPDANRRLRSARWHRDRDIPAAPRGGPAPDWDLSGEDGRCFAFAGGQSEEGISLRADPNYFYPLYGYNTNYPPGREDRSFNTSVDVCTDLKLSAVLLPGEAQSSVTLKLSSFTVHFEAEFHTDGNVVLKVSSPDIPHGGFSKLVKVAPCKPGEGRRIALTHADFRAAVWVDGECVLATTDEEYPGAVEAADPGHSGCYGWLLRQLETLRKQDSPVPIPEVKISAGGGACRLRHVSLYRDVYYTSAFTNAIPPGPFGDYAREINLAHKEPEVARAHHFLPGDIRHRRVAERDDHGPGWATTGNPIQLARNDQDHDLDEFFMMGDNSPQSQDGRSWTSAASTLRLYGPDNSFLYQLGTVPRYNLLGKAMFVYWPSGFRIPVLNLSIVPNVGKMRFIR